MGIRIKKQWRVEYNLNAEITPGFTEYKEFRTLSGASMCVNKWFNKSARGAIIQITRIGDRV